MSAKKKLFRFEQLHHFPNVFENFEIATGKLLLAPEEEVIMKGKWLADYFDNNNPITLELACGGGEYTLSLAKMYPNRNFIGMDIKGARIWKGAKAALESEMKNVAFLRARIEFINCFFEEGEIAEIWITFPDPFLRESGKNRRLTAPIFIAKYKMILRPTENRIHLKTDDNKLYHFTLSTIEKDPELNMILNTGNVYDSLQQIKPELLIKTHYENKHIANGRKIKYIQFEYGTDSKIISDSTSI